ncbi:BTB/POZ domain plant protein [Medicago truncatula]|uniref:BTB/POZ domain plant protein n=1 Tax=Medicago truncatula TaxID=3880 RepID=G7JSK2_MEDTR|nr:BTB/POZ domain plant protein [Medicago truncatula]
MLKHGFISDPTISSFSPSRTFPSPPPPPPPLSKPQSQSQSQSLFDMISSNQTPLSDDNRRKMQDRVNKLLQEAHFIGGDVKLTVVGKEGIRVSMDVKKSVLAEKSRFFAEKLRGSGNGNGMVHSVEISDCDDVDVYVEAIVLMHCVDLKNRLRFMADAGVSKVLNLLKVSAAIMFDLGVMSCLEYLEAIPWTEDEQREIISQLVVFYKPTDDKARREMKSMLSKLLKDNAFNDSSKLDVSKDTLYHLCHRCISSLVLCLSEARDTCERLDRGVLISEIAREADNIQWIVDILIDKKMGDEFVKIWAEQKELAALHSKVQTIYRYEISKITAQLCIGIGRGHILVPKEIRFSLLSTWLEALYEDFGWMKRASRGIDKKLIEDGLGQTILTLPLFQQQLLLLNWFDRFLNKGDDCPNIQKAFEIWWRRAFIRKYSPEPDDSSQLQITLFDYPK